MPRYLRYLLIWLSCTAVSATAVVLTVHFVVGSTRPKPPVAQSVPTLFPSPSPLEPTAEPSPEPTDEPTSKSPSPESSPSRSAQQTPTPRTPSPTPGGGGKQPGNAGPSGGGSTDCGQGGAGVQTIPSEGGQASVRFGEDEVCLVSAVPTRGFTVRTEEIDSATLKVTFSGDRHRSEITATAVPRNAATVRETSW